MKLPTIRRLRHASTPLEIRHTIRRALVCPDTSSVFRQLLWPFPWHFALPKPLSVQELQAAPEVIDTRQSGIRHLFEIPLFRMRDTPLRSLYRLYDDLCANRLILISYECEYILRRGSERWLLSRIPDPQDNDPVRYAILASLDEALVDVFNWKLELGIRRGGLPCDQSAVRASNFTREACPCWTQNVAGLGQRVHLINRDSEPFAKADESFLRRSIEATTGYMYMV
ncbi:hypothetical protein ONS95_013648 [Cadophora gregata]|uniref:uncharacterized protein n=1 Tax=Cadophora gregata TaxID=51156 RepID=UPI0026DC4DAB|nr:uncharacterized protein ONS95_013648 [Cadophora gregata]KAK0114146.1 hypothetical protein ONS95_013648 [Cadophora gregata]